VLAGFLIGIIQAIGSLALGAEAAHILVFVAMIAMLVFRPQGLMGRVR
jgi:branched-subunit amino acid ABC-type transport system permease component